MAVLDGQQRLTSLFIGLKGTYADKVQRFWQKNDDAYPKRKFYLNIIKPSGKDDDNRYDLDVQNCSSETSAETGEDLQNDKL